MEYLRAILLISSLLALAGGQSSEPQAPHRVAQPERVQVSLVLIDVVVRDRQERPVTGLHRDDFDVIIDGNRVDSASIDSFEEICASSTVSSTASSTDGASLSASLAAQTDSAPRYIVVYFDFDQMTGAGRGLALRGAREFLGKGLGPSDRVMIVAHRRDLRLIRDFTSDAERLISGIDEMMADNTSSTQEAIESWSDLADVSGMPCMPDGTCPQRVSAANAFARIERERARRSLAAVEAFLPALYGLKGRKALVLFTDVLRSEPGAGFFSLAKVTPQSQGFDISDEIQHLAQEANATGASFYTVSASGLDDNTSEPFRDTRGGSLIIGKPVEAPGKQNTILEGDRPDPTPSYEAIRAGRDSALSLQAALAAQTGGRALQRTNDVGRILESARQDLACYYLIGYQRSATGRQGRHGIEVRLMPGASVPGRGGISVRYRPYYNDLSGDARRQRILGSALRAPDLFRSLPVSSEAFALAPMPAGRQVLVKATVPLDSLFLTPAGGSVREGSAMVRGEVTQNGETVCSFENTLPLKLTDETVTRLVYEAGCILDPGHYLLSVAVFDMSTQEVGARRSILVVPPPPSAGQVYMSEVTLYRRDPKAVLIASGTSNIGLKEVSAVAGLIPQAQRRMHPHDEALLSFLLCPRGGAVPDAEHPIVVRRTLRGDDDQVVGEFRDIRIVDSPDPATHCYQVTSAIPGDSLGSGVYRMTIQAISPGRGSPVQREIDIEVE